jgi:hypothetical protein
MPNISAQVFATGGAVLLDITPSKGVDLYNSPMALYRYTGSLSSSATLLFSGTPYQLKWIDNGDELPNYLDFGTTYFYQVVDSGGTFTTSGIVPATENIIITSYLDKILFRAFSAGINSLALPEGFKKIRVLEAMPLTQGSEQLPMIVMNLDLEQQTELGIGALVNSSLTNIYEIQVISLRRYSISILTKNAQERDFYKNACVGVFYIMMQSLSLVGLGFTINYQASNNQCVGSNEDPGFYECVFMLDMTGNFNLQVQTNYGIIESIVPVISATVEVVGGPVTIIPDPIDVIL